MSVTLSVIIPAYNVERYLEKCIYSVLNSTFQNFEILLIDDGSTDNTGGICDCLAERYPQITVFHTPNRGLANARNLGIDHANGQYIEFVDSDDCVSPRMLEVLVKAMRDDVQMAVCSYVRCQENEDVDLGNRIIPTAISNQRDGAEQLISGQYGAYVWNKIFVRDILNQYRIRFEKDCRAIEDMYFTWTYVQYCTNIAFTEEQLYQYIMHSESIMNHFRNCRAVTEAYVNLPRGWRYCAETVSTIAPELALEPTARAVMFYQTVLRKLESPCEEYIQEAADYVHRNRRYLRKYMWGWKYYGSALILAMGFPVWEKIFRRRVNDR